MNVKMSHQQSSTSASSTEQSPSSEARRVPEPGDITPGLRAAGLVGAGLVTAGLWWLISTQVHTWSWFQQLGALTVSFILIYVGITDGMSRRITTITSRLSAVAAVALMIATMISGQWWLATMAAGLAVVTGVVLVACYVFAPVPPMGGGDVRLIPPVVGILALLHPALPFVWLMFTFALTLMSMIVAKVLGKSTALPLGPFMAIALIPTSWYFSQITAALIT